MTFSESLSLVLFPLSALLCCRKAPIPALALAVAWMANLAYAFHWFKPEVDPNEALRLVSTFTGIVGAAEFGMGVERMKRFRAESIPETIRRIDAQTWIGLSLLASMGVDGFGMIVWRMFNVWIVPEATIGILVSIALFGMFGRETER